MSASSANQPPGLGLWQATALVIAHTIAVGIFLTPAETIGALASPGWTLGIWIACGALVLAGAFTFGELASRYPLAGGPYIYLREGWGGRVAFLYGWQSMLVMDPGITAALAAGASEYLVLLWPAAADAGRWLPVALIWLLAGISLTGLKLSARVLGLMTAFKLGAFAAVVVVGLTAGSGSWENFAPLVDRQGATSPLAEGVAIALIAVFFSFGGFWEASRIAGEVRDAQRTMPIALAVGVGCVTLVYVATTVAFIYLVPVEQAASATGFARLAGEAMFGSRGPAVLASVVVLSVAASLLALLIMAPRLYVAMARDGVLPPALAGVGGTDGNPVRATVLLALLASLFVSVATFQQIVAVFMCTALTFIALAAAALVAIRGRGDVAAPFEAPGYPVSTALFVLLVAAVVLLLAMNRPAAALTGLAIVLAGVPVHRAMMRSG